MGYALPIKKNLIIEGMCSICRARCFFPMIIFGDTSFTSVFCSQPTGCEHAESFTAPAEEELMSRFNSHNGCP